MPGCWPLAIAIPDEARKYPVVGAVGFQFDRFIDAGGNVRTGGACRDGRIIALPGFIPVALLALTCNFVQMRRRVPGSVLATVAIGFQVAGVLVGSLMLNASVPYAGWMDYGFETGSVFFVIYMTLSLAQRARKAEAGWRPRPKRCM